MSLDTSAPAAAPDRCPRCGAAFHCGATGPAPCACTTVTLSPALQARLRERFKGCLCLACLRALAQEFTALDASQASPLGAGDGKTLPRA